MNVYLAFAVSHALSQGFYIRQGLPLVNGKLNAKAFKPATKEPMKVRGNFQMSASSRVSNEGLVILHFQLVGMNLAGSLARLLHEYMRSYLDEKSLVYEEITFNLESNVEEHGRTLKSLARRVK